MVPVQPAQGWAPADIAARAYRDLKEGQFVNLGIGLPITLLAAAEAEPKDIVFHSENGVLGLRAQTDLAAFDGDLIDAGKNPASIASGGSFFSHAESFAMIRGGHIDVAVLGAFEVAANGDFANWSASTEPFARDAEGATEVPAVGGAVDLAAGAREVVVLLKSAQRNGRLKLLPECRLPLTGCGCVSRVYCDLGILRPAGDHFVVEELAEGITPEHVAELFGGSGMEVRFAGGEPSADINPGRVTS